MSHPPGQGTPHVSGIRRAFASVLAGCVYFVVVFILGFLVDLLALPVLFLTRNLGLGLWPWLWQGTLFSLLIKTAVSWIVSGWVILQFRVGPCSVDRLVVGFMAFAMFMLVEAWTSLPLSSLSLAEYLASYAEPTQALRLAFQIALALFPLLRRRRLLGRVTSSQHADLPPRRRLHRKWSVDRGDHGQADEVWR